MVIYGRMRIQQELGVRCTEREMRLSLKDKHVCDGELLFDITIEGYGSKGFLEKRCTQTYKLSTNALSRYHLISVVSLRAFQI